MFEKEATEYAEGMAEYYASTHEDCIPSQFEKYLRNAYISSAKPREKRIAELEAQLEREKNLNQCLSDHNEQLRELIEKMKNCRNCKKEKIEGACGHFTQVGWCKNWELAD